MGVTVRQYQGPKLRFESAEAYGDWLFSKPDDPDHAVDLHETWDSHDEEVAGQAYLDKRAEELGL
jgi:hypothetical protein